MPTKGSEQRAFRLDPGAPSKLGLRLLFFTLPFLFAFRVSVESHVRYEETAKSYLNSVRTSLHARRLGYAMYMAGDVAAFAN